MTKSRRHSENYPSSIILTATQATNKFRKSMLKSKEHMRHSLMCPRESHTIFTERRASNSSKKIHSGKEVISEPRCGYHSRSSIQEERRSIASEEDKFVNIARVQEI